MYRYIAGECVCVYIYIYIYIYIERESVCVCVFMCVREIYYDTHLDLNNANVHPEQFEHCV